MERGDGWLCLSRKKDEKVVIDGGIEVMVVEIRGDKVRLGFKAPGRVILRGELEKRLTPDTGTDLPLTTGGDRE